MLSSALIAVILAPLLALARTDLSGCTSSTAGPSLIWYVPGTGELCDFLDCGGGRAPVKTTVPGCPLYSGTATYSPSYLPGYGPNAAVATGMASPASVATSATPSVNPAGSVAGLITASSSLASSSPVTTPTPYANTTSTRSSSRASTTVYTSATGAAGNGTGAATTTGFAGEARQVGAQLGLVGFIGAVVALL